MHAPRALLSFPWEPPGELPGKRPHVSDGEALTDGMGSLAQACGCLVL